MKSDNRNEHLGTVSLYLDSGTLHGVGGVLYFIHRTVTMFKGKPSFPNHFRPVELRFGCFGKRLPRFFVISQIPDRRNQTTEGNRNSRAAYSSALVYSSHGMYELL